MRAIADPKNGSGGQLLGVWRRFGAFHLQAADRLISSSERALSYIPKYMLEQDNF